MESVVIDPSSGIKLWFEDDGRVAYAYLVASDGAVIADVWIYNRLPTTTKAEWLDPNKMPFVNPSDFVREDVVFNFATESSDISVQWTSSNEIAPTARIFLHGHLVAVLSAGDRPGYSALAAKDGPLARVLRDVSSG